MSPASAGEVGDVALAGTAIAERFAQRRNMDPEGGLFDDRARPRPGDRLLFRDRLAGALGERRQNVKRASAEAHRFPVLRQHALRGDQPERSEGEDLFIHRAIASAPYMGCTTVRGWFGGIMALRL